MESIAHNYRALISNINIVKIHYKVMTEDSKTMKLLSVLQKNAREGRP